MSDVLSGQIVRAAHNTDHETRIDALEAALGVATLTLTAGGTGTTTSSSYADVPGTSSASLTKVSSSTRLMLRLSAGFFGQNVNNAECMFGLRINGVDYDMAAGLAAPQLTQVAVTGFRSLAGLAAGTYTIQARWRRVSGTSTVSRDASTYISLQAEERI